MPIPKKRTNNQEFDEARAYALSKAVAIIKDYCSKTDADLWQSIVNQNPTVTIPAALKERGIEMSNGKIKLNDLLKVEAYSKLVDKAQPEKIAKPETLLDVDKKKMLKDSCTKQIEKYTDGVTMEDILNNKKQTAQDLKELIIMFKNS